MPRSSSCSSVDEPRTQNKLDSDSDDIHEPSRNHGRRTPPVATMRERNTERDTRRELDPQSTNRAWYEFDLVVLMTLVSPLGNWLTGGDHVKNMMFISLLIFYLHQVVEVPWSLYMKARKRRRPSNLPPVTSEDKYKDLAISELQSMELCFLALTITSPFLGAYLLRYGSSYILGPDSVSWFSTGLFVMATGMRPWSHLIQRLSQRTTDLQDFIHYPPEDSFSEDLQVILKRLEKLEDSVMRTQHQLRNKSEDIYDYVDDTVEELGQLVRKQEKRWDNQEGRVRSLEEALTSMAKSERRKQKGTPLLPTLTIDSARSLVDQVFPTWFLSSSEETRHGSAYSPTSHSLKSVPTSALNSPLETIVEEDTDYHPSISSPSNLVKGIIYRAGYIVTFPLRSAIRLVLSGTY